MNYNNLTRYDLEDLEDLEDDDVNLNFQKIKKKNNGQLKEKKKIKNFYRKNDDI